MRRRHPSWIAVVATLFVPAGCWSLDGFSGGEPGDLLVDGAPPSEANRADGSSSPPRDEGGQTTEPGDGASPDAPPRADPMAFVQANARFFDNVSTATLNLATGVGAHHALVVAVTHDSSGPLTVALDKGSALTELVGPTPNSGSHSSMWAIYDLAAGVAGVTVSVTGGSAPTYLLVYGLEYSGITAFDVGSTNEGSTNGTDAMTTSLTTTSANELLVGYGFSSNSAAAGTGFTARSRVSQNVVEDRVLGAAGAYAATATPTTSGGWQMLAAAFRGP